MTTFCQVAYVKTYVQEVPWQRLHEVSKILIHSICYSEAIHHSLSSCFQVKIAFTALLLTCKLQCKFLNCRTVFPTSTHSYTLLMGSAFAKLSSAEMVRKEFAAFSTVNISANEI